MGYIFSYFSSFKFLYFLFYSHRLDQFSQVIHLRRLAQSCDLVIENGGVAIIVSGGHSVCMCFGGKGRNVAFDPNSHNTIGVDYREWKLRTEMSPGKQIPIDVSLYSFI